MQIVQGIDSFKQYHQEHICLALGNFDGVHVGHCEIIQATIAMAKKSHQKSAVLLFIPHPISVLFPERAIDLLLSIEDRIRLLGEAGIDFVIIHPFSKELAAVSPEMFAANILFKLLSVSGVIVGYDYSFGTHGRGTPADLVQLGKRFGFCVQVIDPVTVEDEIVGSTTIRYLLTHGDIVKANKLLGYHFFLRGKVVHGDGRGRQLGFPTANLEVSPDVILPSYGVYLTKVRGQNIDAWALTNIGKRPTFNKNEPSVEVHLFDFTKNLYNDELFVYFIQRMREEKTFVNVNELIAQINSDIVNAKVNIAKNNRDNEQFPPFSSTCI